MDDVKGAVEAILFSCDGPVSLSKLGDLLPEAGAQDIRGALTQLQNDYEQAGRAFALGELAGGYQLLTRPKYADIIAKLRKAPAERKLSGAALETLAIIAYKQPVKRVDVEAIRGAQSGELIRALLERNLVRIAGRDTVPGSPLLYGTTREFLETFGLKSTEDLPRPEELK